MGSDSRPLSIKIAVALLVEENGVLTENHCLVAIHRQTLSNNVVSSTPHHELDSNSQR